MGTQGHSSHNTRDGEIIQSGQSARHLSPRYHGSAGNETTKWWPQRMNELHPQSSNPVHVKLGMLAGPASERRYNPDYLPFICEAGGFRHRRPGRHGCHLMDPVYWSLKLKFPTAVKRKAIRFLVAARRNRLASLGNSQNGRASTVKVVWYDGGRRSHGYPRGRDVPENGSVFVGEKGKLIVEHSRMPFSGRKRNSRTIKPSSHATTVPGHHREWISAC